MSLGEGGPLQQFATMSSQGLSSLSAKAGPCSNRNDLPKRFNESSKVVEDFKGPCCKSDERAAQRWGKLQRLVPRIG